MNILSVLHELQCFLRFEYALDLTRIFMKFQSQPSFFLVARGTAELGIIKIVFMGK